MVRPSAKRNSVGILNSDWFRVGGGDGFYTQQDPTDWTIVYAESQDGAVNRLDLRTGHDHQHPAARGARGGPGRAVARSSWRRWRRSSAWRRRATASNVVPEPPAGEAFRFFWNTPTVLSPHNPSIVWVGGNRLFKSLNRGDTCTMSPDLTQQPEPVHAPDHGRGRRRADGVEARRRGDDQRHHDRGRVARRAGHRLGGHQRRQPPGEPRRRRDLEERRGQRQGRAGRDAS